MSEGDPEVVVRALKEWSENGFLKMIRPFDEALDEENCVEMLKPIGWN